ncbi:lactonase family protein [Actinoplanes sp. LDG1-06]|uniref:Lactonase family protein n=1 Tax=Paractinoplanes ovalisporus TaxID=2810368 RepID=A0ABS2AHV5_9ACTN|nr:lactonase family protein [Actinoplanes ovalisporus]MBM2619421.1 lactonase family protein [Actinoplanes ovalisporus]
MPTSRRGLLRLGGAAVVGVAAGTAVLRNATADATELPEQRFHLGTYTASGGLGIARGRVDPQTGRPAIDFWTTAVRQPSWLDIAPGSGHLYAVSEVSPDGTVNALTSDTALLNTQPTGSGPAHVAVHPNGQFLFTSLYGGGAVVTHRIAGDGTVGAATDTRRQSTGGRTSNAHQVVVDPDGDHVLAVDLGVDTVFTYRLDPAAATLAETGRLTLPTGTGPRHLAFHPDGAYAYVAGELNSTVTVCAYADGVLTAGQVTSTVLSPGVTNYPGEIAVSADGRFVYVSNRGTDTVAVFAVSAGGAHLTLVATPPCGGVWPRHLAIDATGTWLYVANERSGTLAWFPLDAETGVPGPAAGSIAVPAVTQIRFG